LNKEFRNCSTTKDTKVTKDRNAITFDHSDFLIVFFVFVVLLNQV